MGAFRSRGRARPDPGICWEEGKLTEDQGGHQEAVKSTSRWAGCGQVVSNAQ